jgi:hypothetical protein
MAEMHALRSTTDGASGISGGNLHCLNTKKYAALMSSMLLRVDVNLDAPQGLYNNGFWRVRNDVAITATGDCNLELRDHSFAKVSGECKVSSRDNASVKAKGRAIIDAGGSSEVMATDNVVVYASDKAKVSALGRAIVYAHDDCQVEAYEGCTIFAGGNCRVKVVSWGAVTVHLSDNAKIDDLVGQAKILRERDC